MHRALRAGRLARPLRVALRFDPEKVSRGLDQRNPARRNVLSQRKRDRRRRVTRVITRPMTELTVSIRGGLDVSLFRGELGVDLTRRGRSPGRQGTAGFKVG